MDNARDYDVKPQVRPVSLNAERDQPGTMSVGVLDLAEPSLGYANGDPGSWSGVGLLRNALLSLDKVRVLVNRSSVPKERSGLQFLQSDFIYASRHPAGRLIAPHAVSSRSTCSVSAALALMKSPCFAMSAR